MYKIINGLAGLAALTAFAAPAIAGKTYERYQNVVEVPAPIPYTETYKWYLRADIGGALARSGSMSITGLPLPLEQPGDWAKTPFAVLGFGRYITPSLRGEFTVDMRRKTRVSRYVGELQYTTPVQQIDPDTTGYHVYDVQRAERMDVGSGTFMLNAYYDLHKGGRIRPYVGAGIGIANYHLRRSSAEIATCNDADSSWTDLGGTNAGCHPGVTPPGPLSSASTGANTAYGLAAQIAAGVSIAISPRVHWDTAYHMMWHHGRALVRNNSVAGFSQVKIGDVINHEIRTGLRWDIW